MSPDDIAKVKAISKGVCYNILTEDDVVGPLRVNSFMPATCGNRVLV